MKKNLFSKFSTLLLLGAALFLSSCLKDSRFVDFSKVGTAVEFPLGGQSYFAADAITDPGDTIVRKFSVNVSSPTVPKTATTITLAVDNSIVTSYDAANSTVSYLPMPANAFVFTNTTVTIPANQRTAIVSVTFYKHLLDPSKSYMLPIKIAGNSGGYTISSNFGIHYYHFIGNDFAGTYFQEFRRYNAADSVSAPLNGQSFPKGTTVFNPVSPTQFEVYSGYAGFIVRYEVSFTKTVNAGVATYSNFTVAMNSDDITNNFGSTITLTQKPVFLNPPFDPAGPLTFAQALKIFRFQYIATTTAPRYLVDRFYK